MALQIGEAEASRPRHIDNSAGDDGCRFVEALVALAFRVEIAELRRGSRGRAPVALARQTAMYLAHVHLGLSLERAGQAFGRDRTTVAHACRRVEDSRDDPDFERPLVHLEMALQCWKRSLAVGVRA
jgi:hypothetical protein